VARLLEDEVFQAAADSGVVGALSTMIALERARCEREEREAVAAEFSSLLKASGLTQGAFAALDEISQVDARR